MAVQTLKISPRFQIHPFFHGVSATKQTDENKMLNTNLRKKIGRTRKNA